MSASRVRVVVRVRPVLPSEKQQWDIEAVDILNQQRIRATKGHVVLDLSFDSVLSPSDSQADAYEEARVYNLSFSNTNLGSIDAVLNGYNTTIFAYGQTGTGKTYTMLGGGGSSEEVDKFLSAGGEVSKNTKNELQYNLSCSYLEIYNEKVYDLLQLNQREYGVGLDIHEDKNRGVFVAGITEVMVHSAQDVFILMRQGARNRSIDATEMNDHSSRSHTIFQLFIECKSIGKGEPVAFRSKLNLVDLAGSEKWKTTYMSSTMGPQRIQEMMSINQSLSTLGNCIAAVLKPGRTHIPFRDSKLTRLLQDSIGGNTKTTFIATISPSILAFKETCSTLKFADRVKRVAVNAKVNEVVDQQVLIKKYEKEIARLQELLRNNGSREYIAQIEELDIENLYLKEQVRKLEMAVTQEREARVQITNVLKETLEKLKNRQNPSHYVADNLNMFDEKMIARTPPPAPLQAPLNPRAIQEQGGLTPESVINEIYIMEDQMRRVTGECVETFRTNLTDALPVLMTKPISERTKQDTEQIINGCSRALQDAVWRVQHQAMQRAELLCNHSFNIGMDSDIPDRLSDIYTCADQLKSFSKYIHHLQADASFDPRYVFEDICHHLTDSIFELQNITAPQMIQQAQQKTITNRSSTPIKAQLSSSSSSVSSVSSPVSSSVSSSPAGAVPSSPSSRRSTPTLKHNSFHDSKPRK